jgi:hypothetical protein
MTKLSELWLNQTECQTTKSWRHRCLTAFCLSSDTELQVVPELGQLVWIASLWLAQSVWLLTAFDCSFSLAVHSVWEVCYRSVLIVFIFLLLFFFTSRFIGPACAYQLVTDLYTFLFAFVLYDSKTARAYVRYPRRMYFQTFFFADIRAN